MKYNVGDKVKLMSKAGLDELKQQHENLIIPPVLYEKAGSVCTIRSIYDGFYSFEEMPAFWAELLIEGLVEKETKFGTASNPVEPKLNANCSTWEKVDGLAIKIDKELPYGDQNVWELPDGYQFVDEDGNVINATKIALEKKKTEYPKTYEECCKVMGIDSTIHHTIGTHFRYRDTIEHFIKLLICRDAYWKIAGEEMGLGEPWESDYDSGVDKFGIICLNDVVQESNPTTNWERHLNKILDFPTKEMRDAFYENFKELIESCKELL